ncbi:hypothetical protein RFI_14480 [Reticulomyxa filosa]|uniref:Protein kinase domain-containing protein n=1 Tax=Reticulomyxa filosa TaxID=46433 RepID=X6NAB4_RETFI|nr:hypothetical protein RFI_14480 [Reticulomyxa filosa]|eukprot:ETO22709.1 hypothetical protein RFI_14480 [Reticulomyxa filosa]
MSSFLRRSKFFLCIKTIVPKNVCSLLGTQQKKNIHPQKNCVTLVLCGGNEIDNGKTKCEKKIKKWLKKKKSEKVKAFQNMERGKRECEEENKESPSLSAKKKEHLDDESGQEWKKSDCIKKQIINSSTNQNSKILYEHFTVLLQQQTKYKKKQSDSSHITLSFEEQNSDFYMVFHHHMYLHDHVGCNDKQLSEDKIIAILRQLMSLVASLHAFQTVLMQMHSDSFLVTQKGEIVWNDSSPLCYADDNSRYSSRDADHRLFHQHRNCNSLGCLPPDLRYATAQPLQFTGTQLKACDVYHIGVLAFVMFQGYIPTSLEFNISPQAREFILQIMDSSHERRYRNFENIRESSTWLRSACNKKVQKMANAKSDMNCENILHAKSDEKNGLNIGTYKKKKKQQPKTHSSTSNCIHTRNSNRYSDMDTDTDNSTSGSKGSELLKEYATNYCTSSGSNLRKRHAISPTQSRRPSCSQGSIDCGDQCAKTMAHAPHQEQQAAGEKKTMSTSSDRQLLTNRERSTFAPANGIQNHSLDIANTTQAYLKEDQYPTKVPLIHPRSSDDVQHHVPVKKGDIIVTRSLPKLSTKEEDSNSKKIIKSGRRNRTQGDALVACKSKETKEQNLSQQLTTLLPRTQCQERSNAVETTQTLRRKWTSADLRRARQERIKQQEVQNEDSILSREKSRSYAYQYADDSGSEQRFCDTLIVPLEESDLHPSKLSTVHKRNISNSGEITNL